MYASILKKCIAELDKDKPRLDYVLGMLETVLATLGEDTSIPKSGPIGTPTDESEILDASTRTRINTIRELAEKGFESV